MKTLLLVCILAMTGCSSLASSLTRDSIDAADAKLRLKWAEEWKPAVLAEAKSLGDDALQAALNAATTKLQSSVDLQTAKLDALGVAKNANPLVTLKDAIGANAQKPPAQQLPFWELALAVAAAYLPLTTAKEALMKRRVA